MPKQKTYPTSRVAVEEPPGAKKPTGYAATEAASAAATRTKPEATARPAQPDFGVLPEAVEAAGVWQSNKRVNALWATTESHNSWVLIAGVGWKKLSASTDSSALALTTLAAHGKLTQTRVDYREEADGCIHELYVW
jgi:hypothetical protein